MNSMVSLFVIIPTTLFIIFLIGELLIKWFFKEEKEVAKMIKTDYMTDEQMFLFLKENDKTNKFPALMSAEQWKKKRLVELRKTGKNWRK